MIPWWIALITLIVGQALGIATMALLVAKDPEPRHKYIKH